MAVPYRIFKELLHQKMIWTMEVFNEDFKLEKMTKMSWVIKLKIIYHSYFIQSTLVISTLVISNNRLSQRENLILVLT